MKLNKAQCRELKKGDKVLIVFLDTKDEDGNVEEEGFTVDDGVVEDNDKDGLSIASEGWCEPDQPYIFPYSDTSDEPGIAMLDWIRDNDPTIGFEIYKR